MAILALLFLVTAALYASVGFGGGSTYNALLVLNDVDYRLLPSVALICNLIVVTSGTVHYLRRGLLHLPTVLPFVILSVPMAWLGGRIGLDKTSFMAVLGLSLLVSGLLLLFQRPRSDDTVRELPRAALWAAGCRPERRSVCSPGWSASAAEYFWRR